MYQKCKNEVQKVTLYHHDAEFQKKSFINTLLCHNAVSILILLYHSENHIVLLKETVLKIR